MRHNYCEVYCQSKWNHASKKTPELHVECSTIQKAIMKTETTDKGWIMDKETEIYAYRGILLEKKKESELLAFVVI